MKSWRQMASMVFVGAMMACGGPSLSDPSEVVLNQTAGSDVKGAVTGTVKDAQLQALSEATVKVVSADYEAETTTDEEGEFRLDNVPAGATIQATIRKAGYNTITLQGEIPDAIGAAEEEASIAAALAANRTLAVA